MVKVRVDSEAPGYEGFRAMDGDPQTMWHTRWEAGETSHPHEFVVDLGAAYEISGIGYLPRPGGGNGTIGDFECYLSDNDKDFGQPVLKGSIAQPNAENVIELPAKVKGRYLKLRALSEVAGRPWASMAELRILSEGVQFRAQGSSEYGMVHEDGSPLSETEVQFLSLQYDLRNRAYFARVAPETLHPQALIQESDRDPVDVVLRRSGALLADLQKMSPAADLAPLAKRLAELQAANASTELTDRDARLALFERRLPGAAGDCPGEPAVGFRQDPVHQAPPVRLQPHVRPVLRHRRQAGRRAVRAQRSVRPQPDRCATCWPTVAWRLKGRSSGGRPAAVVDGAATARAGGGRSSRPICRSTAARSSSPTSSATATSASSTTPIRRRATGPKAAATTSSRSTSTARTWSS